MTTTHYLNTKAERLGMEPDALFETMVQNEYAYGITAACVGIVLFWTLLYLFRIFNKNYNDSYDEGWLFGVIFAPILAVMAILFAANGVHHILTPESYAIEDLEYEMDEEQDEQEEEEED